MTDFMKARSSTSLSHSEKDKVLEKLSLLADEPIEEPALFRFDVFAKQLVGFLLDDKLPSPYAIAVHGEWGGGKTSLIRRVFNVLKEDPRKKDKDWRVLWFDAWEYERLDPAAALMEKIAHEYEDRNKNFKEALKGFAFFSLDIALRRAINMGLKEALEHFESSVKEIPTIRQRLSEMIGEEGRLVVFVDDLDRCHIDNTLEILEAIKLFLNAKGAVFVLAVDMTNLERAWDLRYRGYKTANIEGKDYLDKIFQLRLSLPPKEGEAIRGYIKELADSLPDNLHAVVAEGCPPNLRKIKRVLSLIYFLGKGSDDKTFDKDFSLIVI